MKLQTSDKRRPRSLNAAAAEIAAAVFVHVSLWLLLLSMLALQLDPLFLAALALLPVFWYLIARIRSVGRLVPVYAVLLPVLAVLLGARYFLGGFRELFNYFAKAFNDIHGLTFFPYGDGYPTSAVPARSAQLGILLLAALLSGLIAYAIRHKTRPLATAVTVLPAMLAFLIGLRPGKAVFILYLVAVTFYLILLTTRSKGTARRLTWLNGEVSAALLVFLLLLSLLLGSFERSETVEDLQQRVAQKVETARYAPKDLPDGMPGGNLNEADAVQYDDRTVLTLETPNAFSMYLKGFTGDVLEDGVWKPLPASAYFDDYSLTGPWVRSSYFSPAISLGQLLDLKWQVQMTRYENGQLEAVTLPRYPVTIRNERAFRDRLYVPYEVSGESKGLRRADLSQDGLLAEGLRGQKRYELTIYPPQTGDYGSLDNEKLLGEEAEANSLYREEFAPTEKVYRAFVEANETDVPDTYRDLLAETAAKLGSGGDPADAVYRLRNFYSKNFTYSLDVQAPASGEDPLQTFLATRTGYDAHFASLAVLLLRQAGFPARYAEGYLVSEDLVKSVEKETDVVLEIPDSASHAWVELYKDGVGWVPVEVTPGYYETKNGAEGTATAAAEVVPPEAQPEQEEPDEEETESVQDEEQASESKNDRKWTLLFLLLPLLLLALLVPLIGSGIARRRIAKADSPEATKLAYRYLLRVFRLWGLEPEEGDPKRMAGLLGDYALPYREAIDLFYKETYSTGGLTPQERRSVCGFVLDLTANQKQLRAARKQLRAAEKHTEGHHGK